MSVNNGPTDNPDQSDQLEILIKELEELLQNLPSPEQQQQVPDCPGVYVVSDSSSSSEEEEEDVAADDDDIDTLSKELEELLQDLPSPEQQQRPDCPGLNMSVNNGSTDNPDQSDQMEILRKENEELCLKIKSSSPEQQQGPDSPGLSMFEWKWPVDSLHYLDQWGIPEQQQQVPDCPGVYVVGHWKEFKKAPLISPEQQQQVPDCPGVYVVDNYEIGKQYLNIKRWNTSAYIDQQMMFEADVGDNDFYNLKTEEQHLKSKNYNLKTEEQHLKSKKSDNPGLIEWKELEEVCLKFNIPDDPGLSEQSDVSSSSSSSSEGEAVAADDVDSEPTSDSKDSTASSASDKSDRSKDKIIHFNGQLSPRVSRKRRASTGSSCGSIKGEGSQGCIKAKKRRSGSDSTSLSSSSSSSSSSEEDVAADDGDHDTKNDKRSLPADQYFVA